MSLDKIKMALEVALDAMPGLIPEATITTSVNGLYTTNTNHLLVSGMSVTILNHSGINGTYILETVSSTTFKIKNKLSGLYVTSNGTGGTVKANLTSWESVNFEPLVDVPYQEVFLKAAKPDNPTYGSDFYRENGYMQVNLHYPKGSGAGDILQRAELIRSTFKRGNTFIASGVVTNILKTPSIEDGSVVDGYICKVVKIPYWADIHQ